MAVALIIINNTKRFTDRICQPLSGGHFAFACVFSKRYLLSNRFRTQIAFCPEIALLQMGPIRDAIVIVRVSSIVLGRGEEAFDYLREESGAVTAHYFRRCC